MKARHLLLALAAAVLLSVFSGCGSDSPSAAATIPLAKFAHKSDLICGDASFEQSEIASVYLEKHPGAEELDLVIPAGVPPIEKEIAELHDLGLPRGHEAETEALLEEMESALEELKDEPKGALSQKDNPFKKANELGAKLGLGDCSRNP